MVGTVVYVFPSSHQLFLGKEAMQPDLFQNIMFSRLNHPHLKSAREARRIERARSEARTRSKKSKALLTRTAAQAAED